MWELNCEESWALKIWCFWTVVLEKTLRVPWTARRSNQSILEEISTAVHWEDWCWSWNSNTLATSCEELIHWKRPWCWERLRAGGGGDDRGWDGWMASLAQWTWVWVNYGRWWWTGRPNVMWFMSNAERVGHDWATELNWTDRVPEEQWTEVHDIVGRQCSRLSPRKRNAKRQNGFLFCKEARQITEKRREAKCKGKKERYTHLNAEFQRTARRDKHSSVINAKNWRKQ